MNPAKTAFYRSLLAMTFLLTPAVAKAASLLDDPGLRLAAGQADSLIPFQYQGRSFVKGDDGFLHPLIDAALAAQESSQLQAKFRNLLLSEQLKDAGLRQVLGLPTQGNDPSTPDAYLGLLPWQTPIHNQHDRGTCWIFAGTSALEAAYRHQYGKVEKGVYSGPSWEFSEEYANHIAKSDGVTTPQKYLYENQSSFWGGGSEAAFADHFTRYRMPEVKYDAYLLDHSSDSSVVTLDTLKQKYGCGSLDWVSAAPVACGTKEESGNCITQAQIDACEYAPDYVPSDAAKNATFGIAPLTQSTQPSITLLTQADVRDTAKLESLLKAGHEIAMDYSLFWKKNAYGNMDYDASATGDGHAMLVIGFDRSDSNPQKQYFILKNSWGGTSYLHVTYEFMRKCANNGLIIHSVVPTGAAPTLAQTGAWLGEWPVTLDGTNGTHGKIVVRRSLVDSTDPSAPTRLGTFYSDCGHYAYVVNGFISADGTTAQIWVGGDNLIDHPAPQTQPLAPGTLTGKHYQWKHGENPVSE
jgi:hypothetical protein